jgi:flagellar basal body-associated protein FliL
MKSKKILIICIIIAIVVIACGVGGFLYYKTTKKNTEEYNQAVKKYERIEKISNKVNDAIDTELSKANEFISTNPDVRRR